MSGFCLILIGQGLELAAIALILWASGLDKRVKHGWLAAYNFVRSIWPWSKRHRVTKSVEIGYAIEGADAAEVTAQKSPPVLETIDDLKEYARQLGQDIEDAKRIGREETKQLGQELHAALRDEASGLRADAIRREDSLRAALDERDARFERSRWTEGIVFSLGVLATLVGTWIQGPT